MKSSRKQKKITLKKHIPNNRQPKKKSYPNSQEIKVQNLVASVPISFGVQWSSYGLWGSLILIIAGFFSLPNYHRILIPESFLERLLIHPSFLITGAIALGYFYRVLPKSLEEQELPKWKANIWFVFFGVLCCFICFYHPNEPCANFYYKDSFECPKDISNVIDYGRYCLLFPYGSREPIFVYLSVIFWKLFPNSNVFWVMRLSSTLINLGCIWGIYILGSTFKGRRMGLILMALWAISVPMAIWSYYEFEFSTAVLASVWSLVFFFKLLQKPNFARFIYLGMALGLGAYGYKPYRPWAPTIISITLIWIIFNKKEKLIGKAPWILALSLWFSWSFLFLYKNQFLSTGSPFVSFIISPLSLGLNLLLLTFSYWVTFKERIKSIGNYRIWSWATSAVLTAIVMSPIIFNPIYATHTTENSIFNHLKDIPQSTPFNVLWDQTKYSWDVLFGTIKVLDYSNYPMPGNSYFEFLTELGLTLGLIYFIIRPSWKMTFVLLMILVGTIPFLISYVPHTWRLVCVIAPVYLFSGWGFFNFLELSFLRIKDETIRKGTFLLIVVFWTLNAYWSFHNCREWMTFKTENAVLGQLVNQDYQHYQVLVSSNPPDFPSEAFSVICDHKDVWILNSSNPLFLEPGQKGKDIVLLIHSDDKTLESRVKKDFPSAQYQIYPGPGGPEFVDRFLIPFNCLLETPGKILYIQRVPHGYWRRRFYDSNYGLCRGVILGDDHVPSLATTINQNLNIWQTGLSSLAEGEITIPLSGKYDFQTDSSPEVIKFWVDENKVIDLRPPDDGTNLKGNNIIYLSQGIHKLTYETTFRNRTSFTNIHILGPKGEKEGILEGSPFTSDKVSLNSDLK